MKKRLLTIVILLVLFLTACAGRTAGADDAERLPAESVTMLDEGVWPVNAYTEGLPVPPGTVTWAMLDAEHDTCGVSVTELSEDDFNDYQVRLAQAGFSPVEHVSEEIKGQGYVSIGTLLSNGEKALSISYVPDTLTIYISLENKSKRLRMSWTYAGACFLRASAEALLKQDGETAQDQIVQHEKHKAHRGSQPEDDRCGPVKFCCQRVQPQDEQQNRVFCADRAHGDHQLAQKAQRPPGDGVQLRLEERIIAEEHEQQRRFAVGVQKRAENGDGCIAAPGDRAAAPLPHGQKHRRGQNGAGVHGQRQNAAETQKCGPQRGEHAAERKLLCRCPHDAAPFLIGSLSL